MSQIIKRINNLIKNKYGADNLGLFMVSLSIFLYIISLVLKSIVLCLVTSILATISIIRFVSKDIESRKKENIAYQKLKNDFLNKFKKIIADISSRKNYDYVKCKNCRKKFKILKSKQTISITCPFCHQIYYK